VRLTVQERDRIDLGKQRVGQLILGDLAIEDDDAPARKLACKQRGGILAEETADFGRVGRGAGERDEQGALSTGYVG
jgi:hypothetical protein